MRIFFSGCSKDLGIEDIGLGLLVNLYMKIKGDLNVDVKILVNVVVVVIVVFVIFVEFCWILKKGEFNMCVFLKFI